MERKINEIKKIIGLKVFLFIFCNHYENNMNLALNAISGILYEPAAIVFIFKLKRDF
jgi:hypothetical protein